ncbi:MAG: DoxX family protein [Gammaproteobacteria bacterium]|nr:DoxX family protein [Gammaproteobacteria bacterium]NNM00690.1 DoxX family protein [Gammaproteobacteria bacterium]
MVGLLNWCQNMLDKFRSLDFVAAVLLRLYLVPVFFLAGSNKWNPFAEGGTLNPTEGLKDIAAWFGNPDWGLGLPAPMLMAILAWAAEYVGAIMLALGLAVRWVCIPLMFTMVVAATTVHWDNGWQAVHDAKSPWASEHVAEAGERLARARSILKKHGNYDWLTERGSFVVSNNGIEWAATYFLMVMALFFIGGGRWFSLDYWIARRYRIPPPD